MSATIFLPRVRRKKRPSQNARARTCWTPRDPDFNVDVLNQDLQAWMVVFYEHPNQGPFRPQLWNRGLGVNGFFKVNLLRWSFFTANPDDVKLWHESAGPGGFQEPAQIPRSSQKLLEASKRLASPEGSQGSQRLPPRGSLPEAPSQRLPKAPKASEDSRNFQTPRDSQRHLYTSLLYFIYILSISYPIFYPISYLFFFYSLSHLWAGKFDSS